MNADTYKRLFDFYREVTGILNANGIRFWINYGTLLGWWRHKSIIPWDYDADLCIMNKDYQRAIDCLGKLARPSFYHDPGCFAAVPIKWASNTEWDIGIDFVAYELIDGKLIACVKECTKQQYRCIYDYDADDIFPLQQVLFCGRLAWVPKNTEKILLDEYKDLSVPAGMTGEPILINEVKEETTVAKRNYPYIIRNFTDVPDEKEFRDAFRRENEIFGYTYVDETTAISLDSKVLDVWDALPIDGNMPYKLLDSWSKELSPPKWAKQSELGINYAISGCGITKEHVDPPHGDGWLCLYRGSKVFEFPEVMQAGHIGNNDLIVFPQSMRHAVITNEKSIGCAGVC